MGTTDKLPEFEQWNLWDLVYNNYINWGNNSIKTDQLLKDFNISKKEPSSAHSLTESQPTDKPDFKKLATERLGGEPLNQRAEVRHEGFQWGAEYIWEEKTKEIESLKSHLEEVNCLLRKIIYENHDPHPSEYEKFFNQTKKQD